MGGALRRDGRLLRAADGAGVQRAERPALARGPGAEGPAARGGARVRAAGGGEARLLVAADGAGVGGTEAGPVPSGGGGALVSVGVEVLAGHWCRVAPGVTTNT